MVWHYDSGEGICTNSENNDIDTNTDQYGSLDECCDANFLMEEGEGCESVDVCAPTPSPSTQEPTPEPTPSPTTSIPTDKPVFLPNPTDKPVFIWEGGATPFPTPSVSSQIKLCFCIFMFHVHSYSAFMIISINNVHRLLRSRTHLNPLCLLPGIR